MKVTVYNLKRESVGEIDLSDEVFGAEVKEQLFYEVVKAQLASKRSGTKATKERSAVAGSSKKLYRQKGTGRARAGDAQSPTRYGGGTWGGPKTKPARFGKRINRKEARAAFDGALSAKAADGEVYVVDSLAFDAPSTKQAKDLLRNMEVEGPVLVVLTEDDANVALSFRNLPKVTVTGPREYGVYELLRAREVVFSRAAYSKLAGNREEA